jgi:2-polyprenyl-3-methyl-5-hydroxy-6-metoxy-1,4-benzoquinol methylase
MNSQTQRRNCIVCNYEFEHDDQFISYASNVRQFRDQEYKLWRCPECGTITCADIVNLDDYYAHYPIASVQFNQFVHGALYGNLLKQFQQLGFTKQHTLLDYGCGANGLFLEFLRRSGFSQVYGYDAYGDKSGYGNPAVLQPGGYDFILLQDVIEHVEDPAELISKLDYLLAPGGHILIGTPNATRIDLDPTQSKYYKHHIHAPYHLRLYTRAGLESLGKSQGWEPVKFFDRSYSDTRRLTCNDKTWVHYPEVFDGTIDCIYEPITLKKSAKLMLSGKFMFYAFFGYWLSQKLNMSIMFRKR